MVKLLQWTLLGAALALGFECAMRIEERIRYDTPWFTPYRSQEELIVRTEEGPHGRRNAQFEKWRSNNLGFRGPDADSAKTPGRLRIVAMGASELYGLYEASNHELSRQLEDSLRRRLNGTRCEVEVWNAALPGMALPTVIQSVQLRIRRFAPDVIVLYPTPAFYLGVERPVAARVDSQGLDRPPPFSHALYPRSLVRIRSQLKALVPDAIATRYRTSIVAEELQKYGVERYKTVPPDRLAAFESDLREWVGVVRAAGAEPVLTTHGNAFWPGGSTRASKDNLIAWERFHPRATGPALIAFDSAARTATMRVAADSGVMLSDLALAMAADSSPSFAEYAHFNDHGAAIGAGELSRTLEQWVRRMPARCP